MSGKQSGWDRADDLERIEATYRRYGSRRSRLWDDSNRGYGRLVADVRGRLVAAIAASLPRHGGRLLDLGCGSGDLALAVDGAGERIDWTGVDLRRGAIAEAESAFSKGRFVVASADAVPEPDASFDVVVAQVLFSSLPSPQLEDAVAAEIGRLLKPGGWLAWSDMRYSNPANREVHGLTSARIGELFPDWRAELATAGLLPPLARRLGRAAVLYPALAAFPALRSHLVGRLQRPAAEAVPP